MPPLPLLPALDTHVPNVLETLSSCCGPFALVAAAAAAAVAAAAVSAPSSL